MTITTALIIYIVIGYIVAFCTINNLDMPKGVGPWFAVMAIFFVEIAWPWVAYRKLVVGVRNESNY